MIDLYTQPAKVWALWMTKFLSYNFVFVLYFTQYCSSNSIDFAVLIVRQSL
jgi:hypothetical protein